MESPNPGEPLPKPAPGDDPQPMPHPNPPVKACGKLVRIAGLHNVLSMYESTEEAVAGIADM